MPAQVLWPERESLYDLMFLRASIGPAAFGSEKMNDPVDPSLCEWPPEYFDWPGLLFDEWPFESITKRVLSLDPSKGRDARQGDYSAIVRAGLDHKGRQFVEGDLKRRSTETMLADFCKHIQEFKPDEIVIEMNQYQELLKPILRGIAKDLGMCDAGGNLLLPPLRELENTVKKEVRIRRLGPDLAQRSVRFKRRSPGTQLLIDQLRDFPNGSHDDGPDAWEMARDRLKSRSNHFDLR